MTMPKLILLGNEGRSALIISHVYVYIFIITYIGQAMATEGEVKREYETTAVATRRAGQTRKEIRAATIGSLAIVGLLIAGTARRVEGTAIHACAIGQEDEDVDSIKEGECKGDLSTAEKGHQYEMCGGTLELKFVTVSWGHYLTHFGGFNLVTVGR